MTTLPTTPPSADNLTSLDTRGGNVLTWLRFTLVVLVLGGLAYPLVGALLGGALFPWQAQGSLITWRGHVVGSRLVGQAFTGNRYFIGRPSAVAYDPRNMGGSNYAVTNPALRQRAQSAAAVIAAREGVAQAAIPSDLIAASGSGVDPHVSLEAANLQAPRVARARGLSLNGVQALIRAATEADALGLGQPGVNVLRLNLALEGQ